MDEHVLPTYNRAEPVFVRGTGVQLFDHEGRAWLDALSGIGVNALGHAHPRLTRELTQQLAELTHVSNLFRHPHTEVLARRLAQATGLEATFFCNSGSEANETALKIARKFQKTRGEESRTHFVSLHGGFHGRTMGALSITASEAYRAPFAPLLAARFVAPNATDQLRAALEQKPAALILEPLQGEGGLTRLAPDYLTAARELCDATGTVLIHDEVQCGAGRTGAFLCGAHAAVQPDIATLAKPLGAGIPIGATLVDAELAEILQPGDHGSTFGGGALASRAALVFLDELQNGLAANVSARGNELAAGLDSLVDQHPAVAARRGLGLMQGLVVPGRASALKTALFDRGLIAGTAAGDVLRLLPPFIFSSDDVHATLGAIADALSEISP